MSMFEEASRLKLRFTTAKGSVTTEDLWDMPLLSRAPGISLDDLAKNLSKNIRESSEESFVTVHTVANKKLELQFDIVKHVISVKLEERDKAKRAVEVKEQKEKIMSIIAKKKDEDLEGLSIEALQKMVTEL